MVKVLFGFLLSQDLMKCYLEYGSFHQKMEHPEKVSVILLALRLTQQDILEQALEVKD